MKDSLTDSVKKGLDFLAQPTPTVVQTIVEEIKETIAPTPVVEVKEEHQEQEPQTTEEDNEETAEGIVWLIDLVQQFLLRWFAKRKLKSKAFEIAGSEGMQKLNDALYKMKKEGTSILDIKEAQLIELHENVNAFIDELPMSEFEKETLMKPFAKLAKQKNIKLTTWQRIAIAAGMFCTVRVVAFRSI